MTKKEGGSCKGDAECEELMIWVVLKAFKVYLWGS